MLLKEIIIFLLVAYIVSRILRFLLPIFRISSAASSHMRTMQEQMARMQEMEGKMKQDNNAPKRKVEKEGDYIDYEEVK